MAVNDINGISGAQPTHYEVLGLPPDPQSQTTLSPQVLKAAYRRALLRHHPDKTLLTLESGKNRGGRETYSVDQIAQAYGVLSVAKLRGEYDRELRLRRGRGGSSVSSIGGLKKTSEEDGAFWTGMEVVDLDDLGYDEGYGWWYRGCRCGDERGFLIRESDLEEVAEDGEIVVGCKGCSLWLRVLFGVIEEDDGEEEEKVKGKEGG